MAEGTVAMPQGRYIFVAGLNTLIMWNVYITHECQSALTLELSSVSFLKTQRRMSDCVEDRPQTHVL